MKPDHLHATGFAGSVADFLGIESDSEFERAWNYANRSKARAPDEKVIRFTPRDQALSNSPVAVSFYQENWVIKPQWSPSNDEMQLVEVATSFEPAEERVQQSHEQLSLWSHSEFVPSSRLIRYWQDGLNFHLPENERGILHEVSRVFESSTMRAEFSQQLFSVLIEELRYARGQEETRFNLKTGSGEFIPLLEIRFANQFPIKPRELGNFMMLLGEELEEHFTVSPLRASWGSIAMENGVVVVTLSPREIVAYEPATKSILDIAL